MFDRTAKEGVLKKGRFSIDMDSNDNTENGGRHLPSHKTTVKQTSGMKKRRATMLLMKPMNLMEAYEKGFQ